MERVLFSVTMVIDDSFKQPGAIPFKWEIRPGVPKVQQQHKQKPYNQDRSFIQQHQQLDDHNHSSPSTPQKLRPPPAGFYFQPPSEFRTRSFRSAPRSRSDLHRFSRPEIVSPGCFLTSLLSGKDKKKRIHNIKSEPEPEPEPEPDYTSDLETVPRWSVSTRKSLSSFRESPYSSFSSHRSSPRPVSDAEWAGFGLF